MKNLKILREKENLTQEKLAKKLNLRQQAISLYENKKIEPDIKTLKKLANFFEVSIDYLVGNRTEKIDTGILSESQKNIINILFELTDLECQKVEAYIFGMLQTKKEFYKKIN